MLVFEKFRHLFPLTVAKSWADVVKLGAKQTQTKLIKHGPQRSMNKRQRRPATPKVGASLYAALHIRVSWKLAFSVDSRFNVLFTSFLFSTEACGRSSQSI